MDTAKDIQYRTYVRQKIQQGLDDAEAGRVVSHAEVRQRLAKWLTKSSGRKRRLRA